MKGIIRVVFEGIDDWSRPVFKSTTSRSRFGSVEKLCSTLEEVNAITSEDLVYFGTEFNCEPNGGIMSGIEIIKSALQTKITLRQV